MLRKSLRLAPLVLSTLLLVASAALWVRSYFREDLVKWLVTEDVAGRLTYDLYEFTSTRGGFYWTWQRTAITDPGTIAQARVNMKGWPALQRQSQPGTWRPTPASLSHRSALQSLWFDGGGPYEEVSRTKGLTRAEYFVAVPLWAPTLLAAAWPTRRLWRWRRDEQLRRAARGLCFRCGYDLRYSQGRCPECGERIRQGGPGTIPGSSASTDTPPSPPAPSLSSPR